MSCASWSGTAGKLVKPATALKAGVRALLAKHNIRLPATDLDRKAATAAMLHPASFAAI